MAASSKQLDLNRQPNRLLRQARLRLQSPSGSCRPMSRQELADAVNAFVFEATGRIVCLDAHQVGRLERGQRHWPCADYRLGSRVVLGIATDAELGFYIARRNPADEFDAGGQDAWNATEASWFDQIEPRDRDALVLAAQSECSARCDRCVLWELRQLVVARTTYYLTLHTRDLALRETVQDHIAAAWAQCVGNGGGTQGFEPFFAAYCANVELGVDRTACEAGHRSAEYRRIWTNHALVLRGEAGRVRPRFDFSVAWKSPTHD